MTATWRFKDEWIIRALTGVKRADAAFIAKARAEKLPYLSQALIDAGVLTAEQTGWLVEVSFKVKHFPLSPQNVDRFGVSLLKEKICRKYALLPVGVTETEMTVAAANPTDINAQMDVEFLTGRRVKVFFALPQAVEACLEQVFISNEAVYNILAKVESQDEVLVVGEEEVKVREDLAVTSPIITLVNSIISQAYRKRSSDIHIEHEERSSHVRIRVDGILKNIISLPRHIATGPLVSRIKIMADLDVSNHLRPQDGRTKIRVGGAEVGLRVSTLPTAYGEKVVMRILDQRAAEVPFAKLGFAPEVSKTLETALKASQGIILVTGPTGSGKTTTLYSVLNKTRSEKTNIVTVEDPIEYKLPGINQVQVNEKHGLTFSAVLRSVLRQDPDIIMVGEIRDRETADIAFQAAMTGHMVFSTLHSNDTVSTISRLLDMGVDRFKIAPGLLAITAQRLVRKICPVCVERVPDGGVDPALLAAMAGYGFEKTVFRGPGCNNCEGSGYVGRTSLVEILQVTPRIKNLIGTGGGAEEIARAAIEEKSLRTLTHDALWQLSKGHTDLAEISPYINIKRDQEVRERRKNPRHPYVPERRGANKQPQPPHAAPQPAPMPELSEPAQPPVQQTAHQPVQEPLSPPKHPPVQYAPRPPAPAPVQHAAPKHPPAQQPPKHTAAPAPVQHAAPKHPAVQQPPKHQPAPAPVQHAAPKPAPAQQPPKHQPAPAPVQHAAPKPAPAQQPPKHPQAPAPVQHAAPKPAPAQHAPKHPPQLRPQAPEHRITPKHTPPQHAGYAPDTADSAGKLRVMIAEDYTLLRKLIKKLLEAAGFAVIEAADGEEAFISIASNKHPDLLLSDIHMPKLNGYDLIKGVRETLAIKDMPIIILTTESSDRSQELAFELGADDYIRKPFNSTLLIARVSAALRRAGKLKI